MSLDALTHVWKHSKQEGGNLLVLLALADYSDDQGYSYPSTGTLARKSRLSERQVQRVTKDLEEQKEIEILQNAGPNGVNKYRVSMGGDNMSGVTPATPKPSLESIELELREFEKKEKIIDLSKIIEDAFKVFWEAYPKKIGKEAARKAFKRKKLASLIEEILKAITAQRNSEQWQKNRGQFIPNPATWLNQARWEDEVTPQQSSGLREAVTALKNRP